MEFRSLRFQIINAPLNILPPSIGIIGDSNIDIQNILFESQIEEIVDLIKNY